MQQSPESVLQWHPAFYAGIQIELAEEADKLIFENEHQLGTKPKEIDVLIIKKEDHIPIHTNIGKIFRKYNIVEYKSPNDYFSLDDFYKVYGYACFFKSDADAVNEIKIDDITITLVCHTRPRCLWRHWEKDRKYCIKRMDEGIYYICGDIFPVQLILVSELSEERNFWLANLTNKLNKPEKAEKLILEYEKHKNSKLYKSVMDIIVRANRETFEEVKSMCEALEELMKDELEACRKAGIKEGIKEGIREGIKSLVETCQELGLSYEDTLLRLRNKLSLDEKEAFDSLKKYWK